jgi:beta-galactosidase
LSRATLITPALTVNRFGKGRAYYIAARTRDGFLGDFYRALVTQLAIGRVMDTELPPGVTAQLRTDGATRYVFLMNFTDAGARVALDAAYTDMLTGSTVEREVTLARYGIRVLCRPS